MAVAPKVYIGMPVYDGGKPAAIISGMAHASEVIGRWKFKPMESPFHCANFNALWCAALNTREKEGWTHIVIHHHDVVPERHYVDKMLHIMGEEDVDLLSVVLPIKDEKRLSSTASLDRNNLTTRRLSMTECLKHMPKVFRSKDLRKLGHDNALLLHGSGLFIAKFDNPWVEKVWFESPSKIVRDAGGQFMSYVWDEGWNLSIQMYSMGLKIACTTAVMATHLGGGEWGNDTDQGADGWATDAGPVDQSWILGKSS